MGGMQTILALLAVTLFSTLTLGSYNSLASQGDIVYASYLNLLGQGHAEAFFEKLNCTFLADRTYTVDRLYNDYRNINDTATIPDLTTGNTFVTFNRRIYSNYCNKDGSTSTTPTNYVKISLYMTTTWGNRTVYVGTLSNPLVRIYTSSGL